MKQGKNQKIILVVILLLLLILACIAYVYFATDILKTPEQLFAKYLMNNATQLGEFNLAPFDEISEKMATTPTEIAVKNIQKQQDMMQEKEIVTVADTILKTDLPNRKESLNLEIKSDDEYFFGMDIAITNDTHGIRIKELHDKFLSIENKELKKIAETFEIEQDILELIPNKIPETRLFTKEENKKISKLLNKYGKRILEQIDDNSYALEKNIETNIEGENVKANKYSLTIGNKKILEIFTTTLTELLEDSEFIELYGNEDTVFLEKIKTLNEEVKKNVIEEINNENQLIISVYETNGKTVKTEFATEGNVDTIEFIIKDNNNLLFLINDPKTKRNTIGSVSKLYVTNSFNNNSGELVIEFTTKYNQDDIKSLINEEKSKDTDNFFSSIYDENYYKERYKDESVKIKLQSTKSAENILIKAITEPEEGEKVESKTTVKFDNNIKPFELTSDNSLIVNNYSREEFTKLGEKMMENAIKNAEENPNTLIGFLAIRFLMNNENSYSENDNSFEKIDNMNVNEENNQTVETNADLETEIYKIIEEDKLTVQDEITNSLKSCLEDYHEETELNPDIDPSNFLTVDKIKEYCNDEIEIELIDGTTLKSTINDRVFYSNINIDGSTWELVEVKTLYSADGTLENAKELIE